MNFFTEHLCFLCLQPCPLNRGLCPICWSHFILISEHRHCNQCARIIVTAFKLCSHCLIDTPYFDHTLTLLGYDEQAQFLLHQFKFKHHLSILNWLMPEMIQMIAQHPLRCNLPLPHYLIPVPLHWRRLIHRGFNQSVLIARQLSQAFKIPLLLNTVQRNRATAQQSKLNIKTRHRNIKNAFSLKSTPINFNHVAIVDDVMSTGSTANALAKVLKVEGRAQIVEVWTLMRA